MNRTNEILGGRGKGQELKDALQQQCPHIFVRIDAFRGRSQFSRILSGYARIMSDLIAFIGTEKIRSDRWSYGIRSRRLKWLERQRNRGMR